MPGKGAAPKPDSERARRNKKPEPRHVKHEVAVAPDLPELMPNGAEFPAQTRTWWEHWKVAPLAVGFTALEWEELLVAAVLHARFWNGDVSAATELRLRVSKFGVTAEDRLRLRIQLEDQPAPTTPAARRSDLRLVDETPA